MSTISNIIKILLNFALKSSLCVEIFCTTFSYILKDSISMSFFYLEVSPEEASIPGLFSQYENFQVIKLA